MWRTYEIQYRFPGDGDARIQFKETVRANAKMDWDTAERWCMSRGMSLIDFDEVIGENQ